MGVILKLNNFFKKEGEESVSKLTSNGRSSNIWFQLIFSFLFKALSISLTFLIVPLTLTYLGQVEYGLWVTLLSVISWITLMDIGIGNGLRNNLTLALVDDDILLAQKNISTAYFMLIAIAAIFLLVLMPLSGFVNWQELLNTSAIPQDLLLSLVRLFLLGIILVFVLNIINQIFNAFQKPGLANITAVINNAFFVLFLFVFKVQLSGNIYNLIACYFTTLIISYISISIWFFIKNKKYRPSINLLDYRVGRSIISLGLSFFVTQIAVLLIFSVDNFLILKLLGPATATTYNIAYKIFTIPNFIFTIIITPFWSAFTEAYAKHDLEWIRKKLLFLIWLMFIVVIAILGICLSYEFLLDIWLSSKAKEGIISPFVKIAMSLFVLISIWNNIFSFYLNGIGKTRLQLITSIFALFINIPLAYYFVKFMHLGLAGVLFSMCISLSFFALAGPIATYKSLK